MTKYYGQSYFDWQRQIGEFGGKANLFKFAPFVRPEDTVLDLGCGGGYLLNNLDCKRKIGVEVNEHARQQAQQFGLEVFADITDVPDDVATLVISHNVLEHIECPLDAVRKVLKKIVPGGRGVFVILNQMPWEAYVAGDINQHLYTWNPMTLGTLIEVAEFVDIEIDVIRHMWPPNYMKVYERWGQRGFDMICRWRAIRHRNYQIRAVGKRPLE